MYFIVYVHVVDIKDIITVTACLFTRWFDRLIVYCVHCGLLIAGILVTPDNTFVLGVRPS
jgi:hypothetical protein